MLAETRREKIVQLVKSQGELSTEELARAVEVSVETVRRDLLTLDKLGEIERVHGGAVAPQELHIEDSLSVRRKVAADEKLAIGRLAAERLPDGATIFLDLGTTIDAVVQYIRPDFKGTIFTTSLRAALKLAEFPAVDVILPGGRIRADEGSVSGMMTSNFLSNFLPDVALISIGAILADGSISDFNLDDIHIKELVLENARSAFVLADSTKFHKTAPYRLCSASELTGILTTTKLESHIADKIRQKGGTLLLAEV
ncbi:MAG: DeoR/GlpR family DNA-binding transcription regulator [Trueperella sp.]|nr:DeoR/GlpR family DNA-binding transcription regulator [Trueperella sp.]